MPLGNQIKRTLAGLSIVFSVTVHATIVDHGNYLTDMATGLDWLDVTQTMYMSFNDVTGQLGGGTLTGWRYATGNEFNTLVGNYTGVPIAFNSFGIIAQEPDLIDGLISLLSPTSSEPLNYRYETIGFIGDIITDFPHRIWVAKILSWDFPSDYTLTDHTYAHSETLNDYEVFPFIGSFLVRTHVALPPPTHDDDTIDPPTGPQIPVPEPSSIALLAIGLLGFAASKGRSGLRRR